MDTPSDNRSDIRDFLATRRARLTPEQVGRLPDGGNRRRVAGLRREEVAVLAGVSTEWYTRLEKGHISGELRGRPGRPSRGRCSSTTRSTLYLLDLARNRYCPALRRTARRQAPRDVPPSVQWLLDSITLVRGLGEQCPAGRPGHQPAGPRPVLGQCSLGPAAAGATRANFARVQLPRPRMAQEFYTDWDGAADTTVALLRAEAGRQSARQGCSVSSSVSCPP